MGTERQIGKVFNSKNTGDPNYGSQSKNTGDPNYGMAGRKGKAGCEILRI